MARIRLLGARWKGANDTSSGRRGGPSLYHPGVQGTGQMAAGRTVSATVLTSLAGAALVTMVVASLVMSLVACGPGATGGGSTPAAASTTAAAAGSTGPSRPAATGGSSPPTTYGGIVGSAARQACQADVRVVTDASAAFTARHGEPAPSLQALVADGELRELPATGSGYAISYDARTGAVSAAGACTAG